jgi:hypothetical protein
MEVCEADLNQSSGLNLTFCALVECGAMSLRVADSKPEFRRNIRGSQNPLTYICKDIRISALSVLEKDANRSGESKNTSDMQIIFITNSIRYEFRVSQKIRMNDIFRASLKMTSKIS